MAKKYADVNIGYRAYEEFVSRVNRHGDVKKLHRDIGVRPHAVYSWRDGFAPTAKSLQGMALAGFDIYYILTGKRKEGSNG